MATDVIMPALGVAQQTGILLKWLKSEGQSVSKGEPLMEVETDKATVEIEAAASGILTHVIAKPGDQIPVGQRIALILSPGEEAAPAAVPEQRFIHPRPQQEQRDEGRPIAAPDNSPAKTPSAAPGARLLASPAAKRIARERGVALATLRGSGPEGSVLAQDVLRAAQEPGARAAAPTAGDLLPLTPMRRIVGERMTQSKQSAPHFYVSMDIDMTAVLALRAEWKGRGAESIPSINDFILQACAGALKDFPAVNSTYTEQGLKVHTNINIGMAVALEEGLVVPVIRDADQLTLTELAAQSRELADKAQSKKLFPLDYEGGTFTVSNLGMLGVEHFIAIINPPQCAILAVGRVAPRVVTDGDGIEIKSMMTATLSADHRVVDGAIAARFLNAVKQQLQAVH
jgi:pyruvate dehydrogenase E2 component (dihydrolipoamide acetyltransferase)